MDWINLIADLYLLSASRGNTNNKRDILKKPGKCYAKKITMMEKVKMRPMFQFAS